MKTFVTLFTLITIAASANISQAGSISGKINYDGDVPKITSAPSKTNKPEPVFVVKCDVAE